MKICFVGPANSSHIIKWCNWFSSHGHDVHVISFTPGVIEGIKIHLIDIGVDTNGSDIGKLKYLTTGKQIKKIIGVIKPDIVNAHYATSYGIAMALSGVKSYVLSVWGADIYDFPKKSPLHKALLKYCLWKAPHLFSTSKAMAKEAAKYTNKEFEITPFGVDMKLFNPDKRTRKKSSPPLTIGLVKEVADLYGIDYILRAVAIIKDKYEDLDIRIRLFDEGSDVKTYGKLAEELGISDITSCLERIPKEQAGAERTNIDVAVLPSALYDLSGVVEAQASGTPVTTSSLEGFKKTALSTETSVVVENNERDIADAIIKLFQDMALRRKTGNTGRVYATENFELKSSSVDIEALLKKADSKQGKVLISISIREKEALVVGTVKGLSDKYGIADILEAVALVKQEDNLPIKLRIAGKGPQEEEYKRLAKQLEIDDITTWLGFISQKKAAEEWANMDVAIIPSTLESESFGVSAVEAQACGTAVIISNIPGLMEATRPGQTSIVVKRNNPQGIASAIQYLSQHEEERKTIGEKGYQYVSKAYEINQCFEKIEQLFKEMI